ncbi:MAG TPA: SDR family oxidoreductase [Candidatus Binatia bacterium]|jgi:dTDP-4-dehydrorhamnose reductase|nr:SDR family oxidoreductase [Candidatus Binatia bacterium]
MRILITGGSGYLGRHLVPLATGFAEDVVHTFYRNVPPRVPGARRLDVRDREAVMDLVGSFAPDVIIHAAGSSGRPKSMVEVIELGAEHVTAAAIESGARLIHLSTDVVFDGRRAPYVESDPPRPLHDYGRAKAQAEEIVTRRADHVIVRTSLIYGLQEMDHGTSWVVESLRRGEPVTLFVDQIRNPVWVVSLAEACLELAGMAYRGILHVAGAQALSRAQFGRRMLDWWGVDDRATLSFGAGDGARWPADCTLDISRAQGILKTPLPGVDDVLRAYGFESGDDEETGTSRDEI